MLLVLIQVVCAGNPVPFVNNPLVPSSANQGSAALTLTVNGSNFVQGAVVYWNRSARVTRFVNAGRLTAAILAADLSKGTTASVTVGNPGTLARSNAAFFTVGRARPSATTVTSFAVSSQTLIGASFVKVVAADFNNDGNMDLGGFDTIGNVNIALGNGDGSFQPVVSYPVGEGIDAVSVGDFNNDGLLDLAVASGGEFNRSVSVTVFLGKGDGTFQQMPVVSGGLSPEFLTLAVGDFNGDGNLDIVTANGESETNNVALLFGNGDGTFQPYSDLSIGPVSPVAALAVGDLNRDGMLDIAVALNEGYQILTGNGDGSFAVGPQTIEQGDDVRSMALADINGDGITDMFLGSTSGLEYLTGLGNGSFQSNGTEAVSVETVVGIALGDLNGDGRPDVVMSGVGGGDIEMNSSVGLGVPSLVSNALILSQAAAIADFNNDGKPDFVLATSGVYLSTDISLSPPALSFNTNIGVPAALTAVLTNSSHNSTFVGKPRFSGQFAEDFSETDNCNGRLAAGASCSITVTCLPAGAGDSILETLLLPEGPANMQAIGLSDTASGSGPVVQLSPLSLQWGSQLVGQSGASASVRLTNIGDGPLTSLTVAAVGTNAADFTITSNNCPGTIHVYGSCVVSLVFTPGATGPRNASLSFTDNAFTSPQTVALSGNGI
jgi:hypothetical protein